MGQPLLLPHLPTFPGCGALMASHKLATLPARIPHSSKATNEPNFMSGYTYIPGRQRWRTQLRAKASCLLQCHLLEQPHDSARGRRASKGSSLSALSRRHGLEP